ncbi:hypothetical protein TNCV_403461 [Trichonephila clavipes]|nr:hypothetical protein TNCV_403461 [Trichonephila clavipes]
MGSSLSDAEIVALDYNNTESDEDESEELTPVTVQMNSLAASVKLTYSASMVDRLTDFCLKVRHEIGVSSIKVMNPPIDTRPSLFVAKSESD